MVTRAIVFLKIYSPTFFPACEQVVPMDNKYNHQIYVYEIIINCAERLNFTLWRSNIVSCLCNKHHITNSRSALHIHVLSLFLPILVMKCFKYLQHLDKEEDFLCLVTDTVLVYVYI